MEGLLTILVDLIAAPLLGIVGAACSLLAGFAGVILSALIELTNALFGTSFKREPARSEPRPTSSASNDGDAAQMPSTVTRKRGTSRWSRRLLIASVSLLGVLMAAVLVINAWFIDDLLRWALARQETRTGVHVELDDIDANLLTGRCEVSGERVKRHNHPAGEINLSVRSAKVSLSLWSAWKRTVPIRSVSINGLRGRYNLGQLMEKTVGQSAGTKHQLPADLASKPPRRFAIEKLEISDLSIEVTDHTAQKPLNLPITITRLTSSPFRSRWALFDILFRSNADGSLMGRPFNITTGGDASGRVTAWSVSDLPVEVLTTLIGGPFSLITEGRCDVRVVDKRQLTGDGFIDMDWQFILRDVHCEVPAGLTGVRRALAVAAVPVLNANPKEVPLGFSLRIDRNRFEGARTLEAAGLLEAVDLALTQELAEKTGMAPEKIDQSQQRAGEAGKRLIEGWRKGKK